MVAARAETLTSWYERRKALVVMPLSEDLKKSLLTTAKKYHQSLLENEDALGYWENRGLSPETVRRFGLGFVAEPDTPEDAPFQGRLSIPYMVYSPVHGWSVTGFKFRNFTGDKPKYLYRKGLTPDLFNPNALLQDTEFVCVAEGEADAISAEQAGLPCVGIPGSTHWLDWYPRLFRGYKAVYMLQDNDPAGEKMSGLWASKIPNIKVIVMEDGDVNSVLVNKGEGALKELVSESR